VSDDSEGRPMDITLKRRQIRRSVGLLAVLLAHATNLSAQPVDAERVARLRDTVETEMRHVEAESLDAHVPALKQLAELRDEVGYLRGRLRRGLPVEEHDCRRLEQQVLAVRQQVQHSEALHEHARRAAPVEIRVGLELEARVQRITRGVDRQQRFDATTLADISENGRVLIPAGAVISGLVSPVDAPPHQGGPLALTVTLDEITVDGRTYVVDLRILELTGPGVDPRSIEFVGDGVVLRAEDSVTPGTKIRARVESAIELTDDDY
jgi:hypothetical protein